jgi:hypothetical protein
MSIMPIEHVSDWEKRLARQEALWHSEILDRPMAWITVPKKSEVVPPPKDKTYASVRDRWFDADRLAEHAVARSLNTEWLGDSLPTAWPNLGPEVFPAMFGQDLEFTENTSWSVPILHNWKDADKVRFSPDNFYYKKLMQMTQTLLEAGRGKFYTGLTDFHPGGDCIAAWRDPENLAIDMIDHVDDVKRMLGYVDQVYMQVYDAFYNLLASHNQAITCWLGFVSARKWYVPSNDFSCMVSKAMFDDVFLPGIAAECRFYEASIYHLDGPNALQHLDSLLGIPELNGIQWVYGAGHGRATDWLHVYKKVQAAGKGMQIWAQPDEIDTLIENLRPQGVWLGVSGVQTAEEGRAIIDKVAKWR